MIFILTVLVLSKYLYVSRLSTSSVMSVLIQFLDTDN